MTFPIRRKRCLYSPNTLLNRLNSISYGEFTFFPFYHYSHLYQPLRPYPYLIDQSVQSDVCKPVLPSQTANRSAVICNSYATQSQHGFTLLELLVAMAIFAMLAVSGWQIFDNINRSKERAELQTQSLTQLQYAYQQMQRDMLQVVAYNIPYNQSGDSVMASVNSSQNRDVNDENIPQQSGFTLSNNVLSFVRYADPDPRYQEIPTLERIEYRLVDDKLLRLRYAQLSGDNNAVPNESELLSEVEGGQIQVMLPEPSIVYPNESMGNLMNGALPSASLADEQDINVSQPPSLPKGVRISFSTPVGSQSVPIAWMFALPLVPPSVSNEITTENNANGDPASDSNTNANSGSNANNSSNQNSNNSANNSANGSVNDEFDRD